jgi:FixJ family two-component response regulator
MMGQTASFGGTPQSAKHMAERALVHVVDDDTDIRESVSMLLESVGILVRTYPDVDSFLNRYSPSPDSTPTCLLLDVRMPGLSGMALLEKLYLDRVRIPVIVLTGHGDIPMSVQAMKLGAVDFVTKPFTHQKLLDLVQGVLRDAVLQGRSDPTEVDPRLARERWETLSPREREVFDRIVAGSSNKSIGVELGISIRTVETHRARVMEKLQARSLVDLVMLGVSLRKSS